MSAHGGVDFGGTSLVSVILDADGAVRGRSESATGDHSRVEPIIERIAHGVEAALENASLPLEALETLGVGAPGEVEPDRGIFRASPILPTWREVPLRRLLSRRLGVAVALENDANVALLGELELGAARGADPVVLLTLGTGIGGALAVGGRLVRGLAGSAGEFGHLSLDPKGPRCWCGGAGCLGLLASTTALCADYARSIEPRAPVPVDGREVVRAYRGGSFEAAAAFDRMGAHLARGIAQISCTLAPEKVVLAGGIMEADDVILDRTRAHLSGRDYPASVARVEVCAGALGSPAGAVGAALLGAALGRASREGA